MAGDPILADDGQSLTPSLFAHCHAQGRNARRFSGYVFLGVIIGSEQPIAGCGLMKDYAGYNLPLSHHTGLSRREETSNPVAELLCGVDCSLQNLAPRKFWTPLGGIRIVSTELDCADKNEDQYLKPHPVSPPIRGCFLGRRFMKNRFCPAAVAGRQAPQMMF